MASYERLGCEAEQCISIPNAFLEQDIFSGSEVAHVRYDGLSGHTGAIRRADVVKGPFTCIVRVKPDFSQTDAWEGMKDLPILCSAGSKLEKNCVFHITLRDRKPTIGFGGNDLTARHDMPEHEWTWLAFVSDPARGRRILVDGCQVAKDANRELFLGDDSRIQVGQWNLGPHTDEQTRGFAGSLMGLLCLEGALGNQEIRTLLRGPGIQMRMSLGQLVCERIRDIRSVVEEDRRLQALMKPLKIFKRRLMSFTDVISDILVVIDNATDWEADYYVASFSDDVDPWWAVIGGTIIAVPFVVEYVVMWQNGVSTMTRCGVRCPTLVYCVFGLPAMICMKVWLLCANPLTETARTTLSFMGAFEQLDFIAEAIFEAWLQAVFSLYMFVRKMTLHRRGVGGFPTMILISFLSSAYSVYESIQQIRARQAMENRTNADWGRQERLSFLGTVELLLQGGMGEVYTASCIPLHDQEAMAEICWALMPPSTVRELTLCDNGIEDVTMLAEAVRSNTSLHTLTIYKNLIVNTIPFADMLKTNANTSLKVLYLQANRIEDTEPMAEMLKVNTTLSLLALGDDITDATLLAEALKVNRTLDQLCLYDNKISDIVPFADALKVNSHLTVLELTHNPISDATPLMSNPRFTSNHDNCFRYAALGD